MKTMLRATLAFGMLVAGVLGFGGCASSQFNTKAPDAAVVLGIDRTENYLHEHVIVETIDGVSDSTGRESLGIRNYVSPGKHELLLNWGYHGLGGTETIAVNFEANHTYQFSISAGPTVTLVDQTAGSVNSPKIGEWSVVGEFADEDDDEEPIESVDFGGVSYSRPPVENEKHRTPPASGHSGPPSIPNRPRPGGNSGGHSGGSGGSHAGGGGGHSGGGGGGGGNNKGGGHK